jgi:hypothetical protein
MPGIVVTGVSFTGPVSQLGAQGQMSRPSQAIY